VRPASINMTVLPLGMVVFKNSPAELA